MKQWLGLSVVLPLLVACGADTELNVTSESVPQARIDTIKQYIQAHYSDLSTETQKMIFEVGVEAIENQVAVEGGTFIMGDFKLRCDGGPNQDMLRPVWTEDATCFSYLDGEGARIQHEVTLSDYAISKYETTWKEFDAFRLSQGKEIARKRQREQNPTRPSYNLHYPAWTKDWQEVKNHCLWLGELTGLKFDLPTEAQWEYAARSRGQKLYYATSNGFIENSINYAGNVKIHAVGVYPSNPLGLYDMTGNTNEWVNDWFDKTYYSVSPTLNPQGPKSGDKKVMRGGSTGITISNFMTTTRIGKAIEQNTHSSRRGFRCASY